MPETLKASSQHWVRNSSPLRPTDKRDIFHGFQNAYWTAVSRRLGKSNTFLMLRSRCEACKLGKNGRKESSFGRQKMISWSSRTGCGEKTAEAFCICVSTYPHHHNSAIIIIHRIKYSVSSITYAFFVTFLLLFSLFVSLERSKKKSPSFKRKLYLREINYNSHPTGLPYLLEVGQRTSCFQGSRVTKIRWRTPNVIVFLPSWQSWKVKCSLFLSGSPEFQVALGL